MDVDTVFERVIGRAPSPSERLRLRTLHEAWNISGNEALLAVVLAFHLGDARPSQLHPSSSACAVDKRREPWPAPRAPNTSSRALRAALALLSGGAFWMVSIGLFGMALGISTEWWPPTHLAAGGVLSVLNARAGWSIFVSMGSPGLYAAVWAWSRGRDTQRDSSGRALGWIVFGAVNSAVIAWLVLLCSL